MPIDILMPALSPTMEEGKLAKWLIEEGQSIKAGDVIAEIETDKASMKVEASDEGKVSKLLIPAGTEGVKVNTPIAVLDGGSAGPFAKAPSPQPSPQRGEGGGEGVRAPGAFSGEPPFPVSAAAFTSSPSLTSTAMS